MNLVINWIKPAVAYRIKRYLDDPIWTASYVSALFMCWHEGICSPVRQLLERIGSDFIIQQAEKAYRAMDYELARQLYAWWLRCTRRRRVKALQRMTTGEIIYYDYTHEYVMYDPGWPCE